MAQARSPNVQPFDRQDLRLRSENLAIGDAVQAKDARLQPGRRGDEPLTVLDAICGAVAKILGRHDGFLEQGWETTLNSTSNG